MPRRGLPRVAGGEPWPPAIEADAVAPAVELIEPAASVDVSAEPLVEPVAESVASGDVSAGETRADAVPEPHFRRGLPRLTGGEPWPPAGAREPRAATRADAAEPFLAAGAVEPPAAGFGSAQPSTGDVGPDSIQPVSVALTHGLRRGLPRSRGGESWPPATAVPAASAPAAAADRPGPPSGPRSQPDQRQHPERTRLPAPVVVRDVGVPLTLPRTVWPGTAPRSAPRIEQRRRPTWLQAVGGLFAAAALAVAAGAAVALVRTFLSLPFMQDFLAAFPGEYEPAVPVEPGFAPWIGWQHFFNIFLMVLIIRSGLRVRSEKRPTVFWTSRRDKKHKISLTLWLHQALDALWLVNGVLFVVLLFASGHWARIVPTSWEVFPNAVSAALQYVSLDWPTEHAWTNYNSLQQSAYFVTVFVAAPLATISGIRMSGFWPKKAERLNRLYPVEWARAVHFPVMIYFVLFIVAHVALVMATGALRNLNAMFAARDAADWTGFWVFVASVLVIAAGWFAARPLIVAPIARVFGNVSGR